MCQTVICFTDDRFMMPWIVPRGTVSLWTHGGGKPKAREELAGVGSSSSTSVSRSPGSQRAVMKTVIFTETVTRKITWSAGLFSSLVEKWLLDVFGFYK